MMFGGGWFIGLIVLVLLLLLIGGGILAVVLLTQQGGKRESAGPVRPRRDEEDPIEILNRRYARGELTREEFESMREDLRS